LRDGTSSGALLMAQTHGYVAKLCSEAASGGWAAEAPLVPRPAPFARISNEAWRLGRRFDAGTDRLSMFM
jgi:hypothetical protein